MFSERFWFRDWPNAIVPKVTPGVYAIWEGPQLVYCGMSGRKFAPQVGRSRALGLYTRLNSHASGRLSGDQFCVYVANRLVIPRLDADMLKDFGSGILTLDRLTKEYIRSHLEYQFACVETAEAAYELERQCRRGDYFRAKPSLNPSA